MKINKKELVYWAIFFLGIIVLVIGAIEGELFVKFMGFAVMWAIISFTFVKWLYNGLKEEENVG